MIEMFVYTLIIENKYNISKKTQTNNPYSIYLC